MRLTIKSKLVLTIAVVISITMTVGLIGMYYLIDNKEDEFIKEDITSIADFSKNYIYSAKILNNEENPYKLVNTISELFDVYVALELDEELIANGKIYYNNDIDELVKEIDNTKAKLKLYGNDKLWVGTLYTPIYVDGDYFGKIILQKDYSNEHSLNISILMGIGIILAIMLVVLIVIVYLIVKNTTKPLEELTTAIKGFGKGEKVEELDVQTKDEVGELTIEFNNMKNNISKLEDASKEFFNNATHELKTPLTVINGYTQLLKEEEFYNNDIVTMLDKIEDESLKMTALIQKLLIFSKDEARINSMKEEINLRCLIEDIIEVFNVVIEENNYSIGLEVEDVNIIAIREDVETLISNLIDNALKYSLGEKINIRLTSNGLFTIENSCEEIKYEIKDKLLEAFVKGNTQRNINSSGLGLYICKKISENNGFNISYEIDKNKIGFKVEFNIT